MSNLQQPRTKNQEPSTQTRPRVLTNMAFWQSRAWTENTRSIYPMIGRTSDPSSHSSWREACELFVRRGSFDVVVTMGARPSLMYGLLCLLAFRKSKQVMTEVFLDDARSGSLIWRMKILLYRVVARRTLGILTNSSAEIATITRRFRIPESRVRYVPMHSNIHKPAFSELNDGFVLSAGRTRRDYATLLQAAPQFGISILIIASSGDSFPTALPKNVSILRDVSRSVYLDYLRRCSLVVLPLLPTERSTGQVVLLEAMAFGKPVVASRAPGTADLVRHGENGILVEPGNAEKLTEEVWRLIDQPNLARQLGMNALNDVKNAYTFDIHAEAKLKAIRELWLAHRKTE
jgi:glycosyltransferase involved in cell wall biosynthesis